ncbi:hypothetical protein CSUI_008751 [Cystoisospora suis]|uniref:Uncharacterized protein n=1 Tax=Cystoisospora suis TaxID=483139 RepID=A0A2C6KJX9_9APIC|nr:hypothetical protein CSUI_008751 [Cystoisospora suis]
MMTLPQGGSILSSPVMRPSAPFYRVRMANLPCLPSKSRVAFTVLVLFAASTVLPVLRLNLARASDPPTETPHEAVTVNELNQTAADNLKNEQAVLDKAVPVETGGDSSEGKTGTTTTSGVGEAPEPTDASVPTGDLLPNPVSEATGDKSFGDSDKAPLGSSPASSDLVQKQPGKSKPVAETPLSAPGMTAEEAGDRPPASQQVRPSVRPAEANMSATRPAIPDKSTDQAILPPSGTPSSNSTDRVVSPSTSDVEKESSAVAAPFPGGFQGVASVQTSDTVQEAISIASNDAEAALQQLLTPEQQEQLAPEYLKALRSYLHTLRPDERGQLLYYDAFIKANNGIPPEPMPSFPVTSPPAAVESAPATNSQDPQNTIIPRTASEGYPLFSNAGIGSNVQQLSPEKTPEAFNFTPGGRLTASAAATPQETPSNVPWMEMGYPRQQTSDPAATSNSQYSAPPLSSTPIAPFMPPSSEMPGSFPMMTTPLSTPSLASPSYFPPPGTAPQIPVPPSLTAPPTDVQQGPDPPTPSFLQPLQLQPLVPLQLPAPATLLNSVSRSTAYHTASLAGTPGSLLAPLTGVVDGVLRAATAGVVEPAVINANAILNNANQISARVQEGSDQASQFLDEFTAYRHSHPDDPIAKLVNVFEDAATGLSAASHNSRASTGSTNIEGQGAGKTSSSSDSLSGTFGGKNIKATEILLDNPISTSQNTASNLDTDTGVSYKLTSKSNPFDMSGFSSSSETHHSSDRKSHKKSDGESSSQDPKDIVTNVLGTGFDIAYDVISRHQQKQQQERQERKIRSHLEQEVLKQQQQQYPYQFPMNTATYPRTSVTPGAGLPYPPYTQAAPMYQSGMYASSHPQQQQQQGFLPPAVAAPRSEIAPLPSYSEGGFLTAYPLQASTSVPYASYPGSATW